MKLTTLITTILMLFSCPVIAGEMQEGTYKLQNGQGFELEIAKTNKKNLYKVKEVIHGNVSTQYLAKCKNEVCKQIVTAATRKEKFFCSQMEILVSEKNTLTYNNKCMEFTSTYELTETVKKEQIVAQNESPMSDAYDEEELEIISTLEESGRSPSQEIKDEIASLDFDEEKTSEVNQEDIDFTYENVL